ncbi:MAG: glutamate--tRNA ligase [Armatimonadetes bacterium]|nr:glutamate--tRNA ligase [Armatimonadota bacterium]
MISPSPDSARPQVRTRFAPSPTGHLHVGVCRTAIFAWALARHHGGRFLLRIEDTDKEREVEGATERIQADLRWLGLEWDEGPDIGGPVGPYIQSERLPIYRKHADRLVAEGKAYRCYCTKERLDAMREAQAAAKLPPGYDRHCRNLSAEERDSLERDCPSSVVRLAMPVEGETSFVDAVRGEITFDNKQLDDFIAIKSDGFPTYNFANIVDDHEMKITHIIRGEEFISSTPRYIVAYDHLGWKAPVMIHVPLVLGPDRKKLSKRHGDTTLQEYAEEGYLPEALVNFLVLLGWSAGEDIEILSREEMVERFTVDRFQKSAAIFDVTKLEWMNGIYIRDLDPEELAQRVRPWLERSGLLPLNPSEEEIAYLVRVLPLVQERIKKLSEAPEKLDIFLKGEIDYDPKAVQKHLRGPVTAELLNRVADALEGVKPFEDPAAVEEAVRKAGEELDATGGKIIHPVRAAVTGRTVGPSLFDAMAMIGKERCQRRLRHAATLAGTPPSAE